MKVALKYLLFAAILFISINTYSQSVSNLVAAIDSFAVRMPVEKVYLHIDKPYYSNADTIWMKAYLLDNDLDGSAQSGLLYTELVNDTGRVVLRQAIPAHDGISWGHIALDSLQVPEGSYTLRAYTNWMQNLGMAGFFTRQLYIGTANENDWLVQADYKTTLKDGRENAEIILQLLGHDADPVRLQDLQLRLKDASKTILREKMQSDVEGKLRFNFDVPPKAGKLTLIAEGKSGISSKRVVVPLNPDRETSTDVQFMPEGGSLVAGLPSKTGLKAVGQDGKGKDIHGIVLDSRNQEIATFQSTHKGIGSFTFTPVVNETYTARVIFPKGGIKSYPLPAIKPSGMVLTINNVPGRDSIMVAIQATPDIVSIGGSYSLIGQNGGKIYYASAVSFKNGNNTIYGRVAKNKFPTGVARFTLFSNTGAPIAERIIFIDHHDRLNVSITADKQTYQPNDSVSLNIHATDKAGHPVQGSFSLAITDDSQVKADSTNIADISAYMLLTSQLKGSIEAPGYYFNNQTPETQLNLDNLLLTQGWVAYDWKQVFDKPTPPKYRPEKGLEVSGTISKISGKPIMGVQVMLLSTKKPTLFMDTVTNSLGRFTFTGLPPTDTPAFMVQLKDKKMRMFEARINVDEFVPASTTGLPASNILPWYVNSDTVMLNYSRQNMAMQQQFEKMKFPAGANTLKEVVIKGRKIIKGSKFFAGVGTVPDMVLDEQDMIKAGKLTLQDVLEKNVKGFGARPFPCKSPQGLNYMVYCGPAIIFLDGIPIGELYTPNLQNSITDFYYFQQSYLQTITAEDVRGIEVFTRHTAGLDHTVIEVTTWSKKGVYIKRKHGSYLYRPMPLTWPKEFYKPKYTAKPNMLFNLRSTVHWQPDIITDSAGRAKVSFNLKSRKAIYTLMLQGTDLDGHTGSIRQKISVFER